MYNLDHKVVTMIVETLLFVEEPEKSQALPSLTEIINIYPQTHNLNLKGMTQNQDNRPVTFKISTWKITPDYFYYFYTDLEEKFQSRLVKIPNSENIEY